MSAARRPWSLALLCAILSSTDPLIANEVNSTGRTPFSYRDLFELKGVADVQISPDGRLVAYVSNDPDTATDRNRRAVRLVEIATRQERVLAEDASEPRWSPDGNRLAFIARQGAGAAIVVLDLRNGRCQALVDGIDGPRAISWAPDGNSLAFLQFVAEPDRQPAAPLPTPTGARWAPPPRIIDGETYVADGAGYLPPGHMQLFSTTIAGGPARQLTRGDADIVGAPAWTRESDALIVASPRGERLTRSVYSAGLYRVPADGGAMRRLLPASFAGAWSPAISPVDGSIAFIAVTGSDKEFERTSVYVAAPDGSHAREIAPGLDRDPAQPSWTADGRSLLISYGDRGVDRVVRLSLGGQATTLAEGNANGDFSLARDGTLAFAQARPDRPADVAVKYPAGRVVRLTDRNGGLLDRRALGSTRQLSVRSSHDGATLGAWLTLPPAHDARRRYPLLLSIHGGPHGYDGPEWNSRDQLYAAKGYAVLRVNYRGSTSYGYAFADLSHVDYPGVAFADLMSAVDAAVAAKVADPRRLFVTGGSAGGELTAWIVGSTDRFRAAVAEKPIINGLSKDLVTDQYGVQALTGDYVWDDPLRVWSHSPLSRVGRVRTPTMLIVGEEDRRTPVSEAQQFYNALKLRGVPTRLMIVPGASHASLGTRPSQMMWIVDQTLQWFAEAEAKK